MGKLIGILALLGLIWICVRLIRGSKSRQHDSSTSDTSMNNSYDDASSGSAHDSCNSGSDSGGCDSGDGGGGSD
ncbi:hypothetical protein QCD60_02230 [Pokkaliibacter sp. MBI-7]|uniref:hypothetical protein n=1 Tax=Pokkaliibacter sp. MBI-7 TaxID=3040600 RepID=UPI00244CA154|nr:hypothetical protein [Pokkaliibacter sp. MBI-7]MDH2431375.1 hypothetical protein [Pokkaliibacter sp. MBI-7]